MPVNVMYIPQIYGSLSQYICLLYVFALYCYGQPKDTMHPLSTDCKSSLSLFQLLISIGHCEEKFGFTYEEIIIW